MDIIRYALVSSGVNSSFDTDDIPEDYVRVAENYLYNVVIRNINSDRTFDLCDTCITRTPINNRITLRPAPNNLIILGKSDYSLTDMLNPTNSKWSLVLLEFGIGSADDLPHNQAGDAIEAYVWTSDDILVGITPTLAYDVTRYNISFPPMYIINVYDGDTRNRLDYKNRSDFESYRYHNDSNVYSVEDLYGEGMSITFHDSPKSKSIILPVPVTITVDNNMLGSGVIHAPEKFRPYLISELAYQLADYYHLSTAESKRLEADTCMKRIIRVNTAYNEPLDIGNKIRETLSRR